MNGYEDDRHLKVSSSGSLGSISIRLGTEEDRVPSRLARGRAAFRRYYIWLSKILML